ncbi:hypothetical protein LTH96_01790 [Nesterenkonia sp. LB17]|uniref:hypothetical protein n=1 Tax=unclassified Nesterenkonia TaxID=2629769 RepID=UPI001F4D1BA7|nr:MULTISPECIES: hypothetical protein [unclassified Nesterenkonia]MCH8559825.1 hypothetical protein [Nesterenkonia sp. DZ6]MCH8564474.1 hypothetical protein [Nesterenkonia sp. LB17]MCH8570100.1 hypothetical protein [Nesterenkonia sp. AY15]
MIRTAETHRDARPRPGLGSAPSRATQEPPLTPGSVFPLRRMVADELFSAAVAVIRRSPKAVLGVPFLAGLVNFGLTLVMMLVLPSSSYMRMLTDPDAFEDPDLALGVATDAAFLWVTFASSAVTFLVIAVATAYMVLPTLRAAYGLHTGMGQTVRLRLGRLGPTVVNLLVLGLILTVVALPVFFVAVLLLVITLFFGAVVVLPGLFLALCWVTAAVMYAPLTVVVERMGPFAALGRSWRLNRGRWWRNIGLVALLYVILGLVFTIASMPLILAVAASELIENSLTTGGEWAGFAVFALTELYGTVLSTLFIGVVGTVISLMYLNARIRQEALDVTLLAAADPVRGPLAPADPHQVGLPGQAQPAGPAEPARTGADRLVPGSIEHLQEHFAEVSLGAARTR